MITLHRGSTSDLLRRLIGSGDEPVTLITPQLPAPPVLDQAVIITNQHARKLRLVTSLHGPGPVSTHRQIEGLVRLAKIGVKIKVTQRGVLPSLFLAPPDGCAMLSYDWGWGLGTWQNPLLIDADNATELFNLGEIIWKNAGSYFSVRKLGIAKKWLEDIAGEAYDEAEAIDTERTEIELAELTLFDKRRGRIKSASIRNQVAWWTFHGTSDERVNPFLPVRIWAAQREAHKVIRFPDGRRPTGVKSGDDVFYVVLSREPGGDAESYIVGHAHAVAYRPLVDDASDDERAENNFLDRYPHAIQLEDVRFLRGVISEGIPVHRLMNSLGARLFDSTMRNLERKSGNIDPQKSTSQKSIIRLAEAGTEQSHTLLNERMSLLGCVTTHEIERYEFF